MDDELMRLKKEWMEQISDMAGYIGRLEAMLFLNIPDEKHEYVKAQLRKPEWMMPNKEKMTHSEWVELESSMEIPKERCNELLEKTTFVDEHPEWYQGPCHCQLCLSYGD